MEKNNYIIRIKQIKKELTDIGVIHPIVSFLIKYPELNTDYFDLLWEAKEVNNTFLEKLECFLKYKKVEFEN